MKISIPKYIISLRFGSEPHPIPIGELKNHRWTPEMISLLGTPCRYNDQGVPFFHFNRVKEVRNTPEFARLLQKMIVKLLEPLGGLLPVNEMTLLDGCNTLYDLNKHIKAKKFTSKDSRVIYEQKSFLLEYLFKNGYVSNVFLEEDKNLFRFTVDVAGDTFIWHQHPNACLDFLPSAFAIGVSSNDLVERSVNSDNLKALRNTFDRIILSISLYNFNLVLDKQ